VAALATIALAALLLVRGRGGRAAAMLGALLLLYAVNTARAPPWAPNAMVAGWVALLVTLVTPGITYFKLLFALEISGGAADRRQARLIHAIALGFAALLFADNIARLVPTRIPLVSAEVVALALVVLNNLLIFGLIAWNYRRNAAPARNRLKIVTVALACYLVSTLVSRLGLLAALPPQWQLFALPALEFAGLALLTYAVLRQNLFDLDFALNRTLVYGAVSSVLLAGFGLAKWALEHLVPESWEAGGEYYGVAIALGLFLALHPVHKWVERNVERVFFHPWHRNEEALRPLRRRRRALRPDPGHCAPRSSRNWRGSPKAPTPRSTGTPRAAPMPRSAARSQRTPPPATRCCSR
jgi:hypothetical protein